MSFNISRCSQFPWLFSVQQKVAPRRKRRFPWKIKILHFCNYVFIKISGANKINNGSLWSRETFQCYGQYFLLSLPKVYFKGCSINSFPIWQKNRNINKIIGLSGYGLYLYRCLRNKCRKCSNICRFKRRKK